MWRACGCVRLLCTPFIHSACPRPSWLSLLPFLLRFPCPCSTRNPPSPSHIALHGRQSSCAPYHISLFRISVFSPSFPLYFGMWHVYATNTLAWLHSRSHTKRLLPYIWVNAKVIVVLVLASPPSPSRRRCCSCCRCCIAGCLHFMCTLINSGPLQPPSIHIISDNWGGHKLSSQDLKRWEVIYNCQLSYYLFTLRPLTKS